MHSKSGRAAVLTKVSAKMHTALELSTIGALSDLLGGGLLLDVGARWSIGPCKKIIGARFSMRHSMVLPLQIEIGSKRNLVATSLQSYSNFGLNESRFRLPRASHQ